MGVKKGNIGVGVVVELEKKYKMSIIMRIVFKIEVKLGVSMSLIKIDDFIVIILDCLWMVMLLLVDVIVEVMKYLFVVDVNFVCVI